MKKTVIEIIREAENDLPLSDIYLLLIHALRKTKEFLFTYPHNVLSAHELAKWEDNKKRRMQGEPVSYITGEKEFYSLLFKVNHETLIPRPETELLVDEIIKREPESLLDIGTGAGNIAVSVKYHLANCSIVAIDINEGALKVAWENAERILGKHDIRFIQSDFFNNLSREKFDIIISNPPYIMSKSIKKLQPEIRDYEPGQALDGGADGLDAYKVIINEGWKYLRSGGVGAIHELPLLILEIDPEILDGIRTILQDRRYRIEKIAKDHTGAERMIILSLLK